MRVLMLRFQSLQMSILFLMLRHLLNQKADLNHLNHSKNQSYLEMKI